MIYTKTQLFDLLKREDWSPETWEEAGIEERRAILKVLVIIIADLAGLMTAPEIRFYKGSGHKCMRYDSGSRQILIDEGALAGLDSCQLIRILFHEIRCAYMQLAAEGADHYFVGKETIEKWKDGFVQLLEVQ